MKLNIRKGVFETNSSSTHSLCIVSKDNYEKFKKGELVYNSNEDRLEVFTEEIKKILAILENDEDFEFEGDENFDEDTKYQTYENLGVDYDGSKETFAKHHKTKNGEEFVAFGYYG